MTSTQLLQEEMNTFELKNAELIATAQGKYALVHNTQIVGTFADEKDAIAQGYREFGNVPFLVRQIVEFDVPANFVNSHIGF
jgi:hypothetical protein